MNNERALGLPAGSVRAILALSIVPIVVLGAIAMGLWMLWKEQYTSALGILSGLTGMGGTVVGYYFGAKAADKATTEIVKSHTTAMEAKDALLNTKDELISTSRDILASRTRELNQNILLQNNV